MLGISFHTIVGIKTDLSCSIYANSAPNKVFYKMHLKLKQFQSSTKSYSILRTTALLLVTHMAFLCKTMAPSTLQMLTGRKENLQFLWVKIYRYDKETSSF
jgi:hypothetical protein